MSHFLRPGTRLVRNLCEELGFPQDMPTTLIGDNLGALVMAQNPQFHKWSKHIETKWHWIHDLVEHGVVQTESVQDPEQTTDALTKALTRPKHKCHTIEMEIASI